MARPPRKCPTQAAAARNRERVMPARAAKWPIIRNSGMTERSNELKRQYISVLRKLMSAVVPAIET